MSEPIDLIHRYVHALNARDTGALADLVADEVRHNGATMTRQQWFDSQISPNLDAVPDLRWSIEDLIAQDDRLAVRYRDSGTPRATWLGLEPTGATVSFREYVFYTVAAGRIVDTWSLVDEAGIARQVRA